MYTSVILRGRYRQLERDCCSLTKRQLPRSMSQATWIIFKVTWCLDVFVLRGIMVNTEATPGFKSLHYQSLDERLWTNFLECLILSFSICKRGKLRIMLNVFKVAKAWIHCLLYFTWIRTITVLVCFSQLPSEHLSPL